MLLAAIDCSHRYTLVSTRFHGIVEAFTIAKDRIVYPAVVLVLAGILAAYPEPSKRST